MYSGRQPLSKSLQGLQGFGRTGYTSNLCRKASTIMTKRITRDDPMYIEALSWMSYRYAIGITEYPHRNGLSEAERYRMFRDIEFNTPEFQALSAAFTDFLKRKKITDVVALRDQYRENDLIWLSRNYAMGRHSYAASHCNDILSYSNDVLSPERKEFMARDIRSQIADHLRWHSFFIPRELEETYSPLDLFFQFITENNIDSDEKYQEYSRIDVYLSSDGQISFATEKKEHNKSYFSFMSDIDDYLGWDQLASFFFPPCHKKCRIRFNGQESIIPYINSWSRIYDSSGNYRYERVKIPIDKLPNQFVRTYINQDYIVEDNIL